MFLLFAIDTVGRAADDLSKPIRVSPDGHFLMQPDGAPFFYLGENNEALFERLSREDADLYFQNRAKKGFTVILGHVVSRFGFNRPNVYGQKTFIDDDVARPNPGFFEHADWIIERARHYGLRVGLIPVNAIEYVTAGQFNASNVEAWGRFLAQRYRGKGIIWLIGWDATPIWTSREFGPSDRVVLKDFRPVYDLMAKGILEGEGGDPFIAYHPACCSFEGTPEPRTSLYLANRSWLDMNMIQSSHFEDTSEFMKGTGFTFGWNSTFNYEPIRKEYDSLPVRPVIDGEPQFDYMPRNINKNVSQGRWDEVDIRNSAYHAVFAGAAGHDYNHLAVVHVLIPGEESCGHCNTTIHWKEALNAQGAQQIGHMKNLMLSRPYFTRIPDQSLIVGDPGEGRAHISGTRDRAGSYAMIYLPQGQDVTVEMNKLSGATANAWWYDPRTGAASRIDRSYLANHQQRFIPPSSGAGNDWVLVLDDASRAFSVPGTPAP